MIDCALFSVLFAVVFNVKNCGGEHFKLPRRFSGGSRTLQTLYLAIYGLKDASFRLTHYPTAEYWNLLSRYIIN